MRNILALLIFAWVVALSGCSGGAPENRTFDISVMSFNLRYDTGADGDNQWSNRKEACVAMLGNEKPDVIGIQEGLARQLTYLDSALSDYAYVGVGRDDGAGLGEYSAVFYDTTRFALLDHHTFWLSETPDTPSFGWDAACRRIVTWVELMDKRKDKTLYVFNTHLDHEGKEAREKSVKMLVEKVDEIAGPEAIVFVTGDFNAKIDNRIMDPLKKAFGNTQEQAEHSDRVNSFNAFGKFPIQSNIDFIFYQKVEPRAYKTINDDYGVPYISDHYPLIGRYIY